MPQIVLPRWLRCRRCEHVLVLAAPFALAEEDALFHLAETHLNTGYGVSVLSAEQQGFDAEGQPLPRDSRCYAAMFTWDMLKKALASGADTLDGLVAAAVAAGAQKGIAITNKIYVICDGTAAFMAQVEMMQRVNYGLIKKGVQIFDLTSTYIAPDADIAPGATILPGCHIRLGCKVGAGAVIGPNTILEKAEIGAGTTVNNSQVYESTVGSNTTVGPFAYIRPQSVVGDGCRIGDFVRAEEVHHRQRHQGFAPDLYRRRDRRRARQLRLRHGRCQLRRLSQVPHRDR